MQARVANKYSHPRQMRPLAKRMTVSGSINEWSRRWIWGIMTTNKTAQWFLRAGIAIPLLYYGIQAAAAPFFPDFSFVGTTASELGSDSSHYPALFNIGIMSVGVCSLAASIGFLLALRRTNPILAWLVFLAVAMIGMQTVWAGYYPIPDPRHGGHPAFVIFMLLLPILLTAVLWRRGDSLLKAYLVLTLVLLALMVPVMSGISGIDRQANRGLIQRIFALAIFPPIGVGAYVLLKCKSAWTAPNSVRLVANPSLASN